MFVAVTAMAQERTITGTVTSSDDKLPIPGVSVRVKGTQTGTVTDASGKYSVKVTANSTTLEFTYVGYVAISKTITGSVLNVALVGDAQSLNEVIVTAGGLTNSRKSIGTVTTTVKADQLIAGKPTNIASGLLGKVAGLQINTTSGGTNPNYRVILRGQRSLTGNNEALIVLDNVIVPNSVLGNLNPEDVADVTTLNGASGAALYGSDASNGALIITTKKGKAGKLEIKAQQTLTVEQVAFFPKLQEQFGGGSDNDLKIYLGYENQQYGPAFDGVPRPIGLPLADGTVKTSPYQWGNDKYDFWDNGLTSQSDLSISSGDDKGTLFISGQYVDARGTLPKDKFNKANVRFNGTRNLLKNLSTSFAISYAQNRYDQTTSTGFYDQMLQSPGNLPITSLKDWKTDPFADPSGYPNAYYTNPYFSIDNFREKVRNDYFTGSWDLKYSPAKWVDLTYRVGFNSRNNSGKSYSDIYKFNDYIKTRPEVGAYKKTDIVGGVTDNSLYTSRIVNEFQAAFKQKVSDFDFNLVLAAYLRQDRTKSLDASVSGLVQPGLFNLSNSTNTPTANESNYLARQQAVYAVLNVAFKNYLFLNATARNDWDSRLSAANRSFFYPAANLSFVPTDAIPALKQFKELDYLKLRAGLSKVGLVNVGGSSTSLGAYRLDPVFYQNSGFPFNGIGGFTVGNSIVSPNITPEFSYSFEAGTDMAFLKERINASFTYYHTISKNQTVTASVANSSGYSTYLLNAGQTSSRGIETSLNLVPVKTANWRVTVGANYSHYNNMVDELLAGIPSINLSSTTNAGSYGIAGQPFPVLQGRSYNRDSQGRIIVDRATGYPSGTSTLSVFGAAAPTDIFGLNFTASFKGITLSALAEYRGGYNVYNGIGPSSLDFSGAGINTVAYNRERFVIPNSSYLDPTTNTYVANTNITVKDGGPGYWSIGGPRTNIDENYITSGNFWKIREISLAYDFPASLLAKSKFIRSARISAQGRNLFIFLPKTNVYTDPEYNSNATTNSGNGVGLNGTQTPPSRYYGATLSLTF
ncbi:SusC/RagA family TonB-linked outer membrane protein [Pedobacter miscanthi]|uniref:SusC/RagA family TonB-linked outer membrane protein n=2 Tax=Pedobacter miscanthi TaxID=2259170 RepID=A0A366KW57_9SPHI|nr:SusC/RagA family TonB-linked outer membrane protein [Pedobacter miscanthi]